MSEDAAELVWNSRKSRQRKDTQRRTPASNTSTQKNLPPQGPNKSRRWVLGAAAGGALVLAASALGIYEKESQSQEPSPYDGWEVYKGQELPQDSAVRIGQDLSKNMQYPGFAEVGSAIVRAELHPEELAQYFPLFHDRIPVKFEDLVRQRNSFARFEVSIDATTENVHFRNKNTGQDITGQFGDFSKASPVVLVDNSMAYSSKAAKQLLLVKEFSHLLYYQQHRQKVLEEVAANYDLSASSQFPDFATTLYLNGDVKPLHNVIPSLGDLFDHVTIDHDGAGFWHILPAFGKMRDQGVLNHDPLILEEGNKFLFQALSAGILSKQQDGNYSWKQGITPFSKEWTDISRPILQK